MNAYWQEIAALLTVAVALLWLARQIWLVLLKKQKPGCSGCSNCPTKEARAEPPLVLLDTTPLVMGEAMHKRV